MRRFDERVGDRIQAAVQEIERDSAAEIGVKVVAASADYADVAWRGAAITAFAALMAVLFIEHAVAATWVPAIVLGAGLVGFVVTDRWRPLRRWLTSEARRRQTTDEAAGRAFHDEAIDATSGRTGVLVFVSVFEDRVVVIPDHALRGRAADAAWGRLDIVGQPGQELVARVEAVLKELGALVRSVAPRRDDDTNELSDAPRIG